MAILYDKFGIGRQMPEGDEKVSPSETWSEVDDGTMRDSFEQFASAVVGHKIVKVEYGVNVAPADRYSYSYQKGHRIHLDDGTTVLMTEQGDCCAYTALEKFLLNAEKCDNVITGVTHDGDFEKWYVLADMQQVLQLDVSWSCGNPFYYSYGFSITVEPDKEV